ncbi:CDP-alcohol phosphatidyltransferase family protein [Tuberibacillus sp. Marseille-P3662]|uniref:CDP-alcohol phosphatidyltransferase family protein n=1 Tax=Tuberibacillus sp. Marseille-P3662 TaxID=1965358 RepID=UPI000A1CE351|nr:CDP-alcohol phosphatidyltransferase family protein [Tuberibacillus sp. Marseille-P3662]
MSYYSELISIVGKGDNEPFYYSKYIGRKISVFLSVIFIKLNFKPNTITFLSLICAVLSCVSLLFLSLNLLWVGLSSIILINLYFILDHCDGEVARYYINKNGKNPSLDGGYFDFLVHSFSTNILYLFLGIGLFYYSSNELYIYLGIVSCFGMSNFPRLCLAQILIKEIYSNNEMIDKLRKNNILNLSESTSERAIIINKKGNYKKKLEMFMKELLTFPGCILSYTIFMLISVSFSEFFIYIISIYFIGFSLFMLANIIRRAYLVIIMLKKITV